MVISGEELLPESSTRLGFGDDKAAGFLGALLLFSKPVLSCLGLSPVLVKKTIFDLPNHIFSLLEISIKIELSSTFEFLSFDF